MARRLVQTDVAVKRAGPKDKIGPDLHSISIHHVSASEIGTGKPRNMQRERRVFEKECVGGADAMCETTMSSGGPALDEMTYELIIVDEAAQSTEPETLVPLRQATPTTRFQLFGDHQQLPPGAPQPGG